MQGAQEPPRNLPCASQVVPTHLLDMKYTIIFFGGHQIPATFPCHISLFSALESTILWLAGEFLDCTKISHENCTFPTGRREGATRDAPGVFCSFGNQIIIFYQEVVGVLVCAAYEAHGRRLSASWEAGTCLKKLKRHPVIFQREKFALR